MILKELTLYALLKDTPHENIAEVLMKRYSLSFMPFEEGVNLTGQENTAVEGYFTMCFMDLHKDAPKPHNNADFYVYAFTDLGSAFGCSLRFRDKERVLVVPLYPPTQRSINLLNSFVACSFLIQSIFRGYGLHPKFLRGQIVKNGIVKTSFKMGDTYRVLVDTGTEIIDVDYRKLS